MSVYYHTSYEHQVECLPTEHVGFNSYAVYYSLTFILPLLHGQFFLQLPLLWSLYHSSIIALVNVPFSYPYPSRCIIHLSLP